ncbi:hypothetical protein PRZ48_008686 [Zasmidium cellare]|uniref:INO80 complex subunit B-like conserved region domain-containing protein n=1 Tax=Zasmidium cellare TaxID=395010 RepID=A0ABR0EG72_ZASCE|nr:hypothetical protein PRZ48_008686 [Zasmidium cellare]
MPPARRSTRTVSSTAARESAQPYTRANTRTSPDAQRSSASIARPANGKTSLRLTVKAPPSKLRQATSGSSIPPNPYADNPSESDTTPAPRVARSTRNPRTVVDPDSDDVDEDAEGEEEDEEEADGDVDHDLLNNEDSEEDAEGEDDDMDELQDEHPPPPVIKQDRPNGKSKPNVTITAPPEGPLKSVEAKEMEDDEDDELSELESNEDEGEGDGEEDEEDEESEDDDDENSRSATPDLTKLTKRQRGAFEEPAESSLMALSNEAQKKKHLTAEEHAMRRAEMARRRKNLSEKRNEEEKMDTINKLLKKPAPKRRTRAEMEAARAAELSPGAEDEEEKPDPLYLRWVNTAAGSRIGVTDEWLNAPIGDSFRQNNSGGMVQEVA